MKRPDAPAFFDELERRYHAARRAAGEVGRTFRIGESIVTLRFAGDSLVAPLTEALEHLETSGDADLNVLAFDTESTGVEPPPSPWRPDAVRAAGIVAGYSDRRFRTVLQLVAGLLIALDRDRGRAVCWIRSPRQLSMSERAAPLRRLFQEWLGEDDPLVTHGGAVGTRDGGLLLVGPSGAGKSTSALTCLTSPLRYAADDYCLVRPGEAPHVYSLYGAGKVHYADLHRLPLLAAVPPSVDGEKAMYLLHRTFPNRLIAGFPLRAIVSPQVAGTGRSRISRVSGGAVLTPLAAPTTFLAPHRAASTLRRLASLVGALPAYRLHLGEDVRDVPDLLLEVLLDAENHR